MNGTDNGAAALEATGVEAAGITPISLQPIRREIVEVSVVGETELIMNNWSEKSRIQMLDKMQGKAKEKRAPKDPAAEFEAAKYLLPDGSLGFPAAGFKAAIVDAARFFESVTMTDLKQVIEVLGEPPDNLVQILGDVRMREDTPRNSGIGSTPDLRYRPGVWPWQTALRVRYVASKITLDALIHLVSAAGMGGVGDWRPSSPRSKTGTFGTFRVAEEAL